MSSEKSGVRGDLDLRDEVEKLKSGVDKAISELKCEIEDLKNALVELKSSLNEIENPFNLLSSLVSDEDFKKITAQAGAAEKEKVGPEKAEEKREEERVKEPHLLGAVLSEADYNTCISLIKWVWTLLDLGFDIDDIEKISRYCEFFSLLQKGSSHYISLIAPAVEKARALNLSEDVVALSIYGAAKASGAKVKIEDVTDLAFNALRKLISRPPESIGLKR